MGLLVMTFFQSLCMFIGAVVILSVVALIFAFVVIYILMKIGKEEEI